MSDFEFIQNKNNGKWIISAPRRAKRTNVEKAEALCPFCPGQEIKEEELYRVPSTTGSTGTTSTTGNENNNPRDTLDTRGTRDTSWLVRVVANKFPFAPNHEVIIHSPDHHKNWDELPFSQVELILKTYRERYNFNKKQAGLPAGRQVYIFHNRGHEAGESLPHPHTQLVTIPNNIKLDITPLDPELRIKKQELSSNDNLSFPRMRESIQRSAQEILDPRSESGMTETEILETEHFLIFCPLTSEWPDEVWIAPKENGGGFGFIKDAEITDLGFVLSRLIQIFDMRHGHEFPFNFYIPPLKNWYLRLIPRGKVLGGFELGTNIIVNTQDPAETFSFIKEHFWEPDHAKIRSVHQEEYGKKV